MNEEMARLLGIDTQQAQTDALNKAFLSGLLQIASMAGKQRQPISTAPALAQAVLGGMQTYESSIDKTLKDALAGLQVKNILQKQQEQQQLQRLIPQAFQVQRAPSTQEVIASEQGDDVLTREGQVTGIKPNPQAIQALMMVPGGMEYVKNMAETQKMVRQAGLGTAGAEVTSPFLTYMSAESPEVKRLATTYDKAFKDGTIDEETALKRIETLGKMEESYIARQESKEERKLAREEGRAERQMAREEKRMEGTEGQRTAAGYAERMVMADNITRQLPATALPTELTSTAGGVPLVGSYLQRRVMSADQQLYKQAADDWIRAKLRKESGAVIGEEEMAREYETYFPQPGDTQAVIKQKEQARNTATQAMIKNAGAVFQMPQLMPRPTAAPTVRRYNPATGRVE